MQPESARRILHGVGGVLRVTHVQVGEFRIEAAVFLTRLTCEICSRSQERIVCFLYEPKVL